MSHTAPEHPVHPLTEPPDPRRWKALALISVAQFMLILDVTVVNIALPDLGADLRLGRGLLTWAVTAYTLTFGGLMLLGGRLADLFGARRQVLTGLAVFTLASLGTGLAGDGGLLLGGRIAQGVGAALLSPAALATVTTLFHGPERNRALGVWAGLGGLGFALGVLVGGALTAGPGWRWVFFVNVPVGAVLLALLPSVLPRGTAGRGRVDLLGALLVTGGTAALIYGLVKAGDTGWGSTAALVPLALAVALYAGFAAVEQRVSRPLMRVRLLGRPAVATGAGLMLVASAMLISMFFLSSLYLQHTRGYGALRTGLMFLPAAVAIGLGAQLASHLVGRIGGRPVAVAGLAVLAAGQLLLIGLHVIAGTALAAFGVGPVFVAATTSALSHVDPAEAGLASGVVNTFHELGGAVGVAVASTVAAASITGLGTGGFHTAFTVSAATAAVAGVLALWLVPAGRPAMPVGPHGH